MTRSLRRPGTLTFYSISGRHFGSLQRCKNADGENFLHVDVISSELAVVCRGSGGALHTCLARATRIGSTLCASRDSGECTFPRFPCSSVTL